MTRITKTVHVDVDVSDDTREAVKRMVRTYGGRVSRAGFYTMVCARIPRARLSHFKSTATKKGLYITIDE